MVSSAHNVCPKGYYIAIVSTIAEGDSNHHLELQPGLDRLGRIEEQFMGPPIPLYEPLESGVSDKIFISKSYDATSHFETTTGKAFFSALLGHPSGRSLCFVTLLMRCKLANDAQTMCRIFIDGPRGTNWW